MRIRCYCEHLPRILHLRGKGTAIRRPGRQRGIALIEVVAITAPVTVVCLVLAATLQATGSARLKSRAQADLEAQSQTQKPCGGLSLESASLTAADPVRSLLSYPIAALGLPITETDRQTVTSTVPVGEFPLRSVADRILPSRPTQVTSKMTYLCNEPDSGDRRRDGFNLWFGALGTSTAAGLY